jgi:DNA-binding HxlR family transcriptional regulator
VNDRTSKTEAQPRRPISLLLDLLGRRWTLRVLWDLRDGPLRFRDLQADEISTSVLTQRLNELTEAGIVERTGDGRYGLTRRGAQLGELLMPLNDWAKRWARR